jgi:hypothetical protein
MGRYHPYWRIRNFQVLDLYDKFRACGSTKVIL